VNPSKVGAMPPFMIADYYDAAASWEARLVARRLTVEPTSSVAKCPHGFASVVQGHTGDKLVGYFSLDLLASGDAPDYAKSLFVFLDGNVVGEDDTTPRVSHRKMLYSREFSIGANYETLASIKYPWPFCREGLTKLVADPFTFVSKDVVTELVRVVEFYRPHWLV
jgi:hypothetical protein